MLVYSKRGLTHVRGIFVSLYKSEQFCKGEEQFL